MDTHIPYIRYLERDPDVQNLLDSFQISASEIPVLICRGQLHFGIPLTKKLQTALVSMSLSIKPMSEICNHRRWSSGLAAAVYGASEGLDVLVLETSSPGGKQVHAQESKII